MTWAAVVNRSVAHQLDNRAAPAQAAAAHRAQIQRIGQQIILGALGARDLTAGAPLDIAVVHDCQTPQMNGRLQHAVDGLVDALCGSPQEGDWS